jgi:hypothetical protein
MSNKAGSNAQHTKIIIKPDTDNKTINSSDNNSSSTNKSNYHLIPIIIVLCIIPLIMRVKAYNTNLSQFQWFSSSNQQVDFFLFYKQWAFISVAAVMALVVVVNIILKKKKIKFTPIFIPLAVFGLLALLSAVFSKYSSFSFSGSFELFESVFVLIGYCFAAYYAFLLLNSEKDFKTVYYYLIAIVFIMTILGLTQFLGHDFFTTQLGHDLITPEQFRKSQFENYC